MSDNNISSPSNAAQAEEIITKFAKLIKKVIIETSPRIEPEEMEDIEQEILIKIWQEFKKSEKKIRQPFSYIWRVAYTTTSRMMQKYSKQRNVTVSPEEAEGEIAHMQENNPVENEFSRVQLMGILETSIDSLVASRGRVLKLYLMGMKSEEIAEFLGWTDNKVRNLLYRGIQDLKEKLGSCGINYKGAV